MHPNEEEVAEPQVEQHDTLNTIQIGKIVLLIPWDREIWIGNVVGALPQAVEVVVICLLLLPRRLVDREKLRWKFMIAMTKWLR